MNENGGQIKSHILIRILLDIYDDIESDIPQVFVMPVYLRYFVSTELISSIRFFLCCLRNIYFFFWCVGALCRPQAPVRCGCKLNLLVLYKGIVVVCSVEHTR